MRADSTLAVISVPSNLLMTLGDACVAAMVLETQTSNKKSERATRAERDSRTILMIPTARVAASRMTLFGCTDSLISLYVHREARCVSERQVQQRGRPEGRHATQWRHTGPVCGNGWFDGDQSGQAYFLPAFSIALPALARSSGIMTG